jgi:hypothetical protein
VTSSSDNAGVAPSAPPPASPRTDAIAAACALAFATLVVVLAWRMDRYESQGGALWTAPGLWPGIVGLVLGALAAGLLVRSWRRAGAVGWDTAETNDTPLVPTPRFVAAAALFFLYAIGSSAAGCRSGSAPRRSSRLRLRVPRRGPPAIAARRIASRSRSASRRRSS